MNNREYVGKRIAEIRQAKGLSIRKLADLCGVSAQNITKIEHGRYNVSIDILGKICDALGCRIELVFNEEKFVETKDKIKPFNVGEIVWFDWGGKREPSEVEVVGADYYLSSFEEKRLYDILLDGEIVDKIPERYLSRAKEDLKKEN